MPSQADASEVELIAAHLAASVGQQKAQAVLAKALIDLQLPEKGRLEAEQVERLLNRIAAEPGLVGLSAKVTRQMLKMKIAPLKPAF